MHMKLGLMPDTIHSLSQKRGEMRRGGGLQLEIMTREKIKVW